MKKLVALGTALLCIVSFSPSFGQTKKEHSFFSSLFSRKKTSKAFLVKVDSTKPRVTQPQQGINFLQESEDQAMIPSYVQFGNMIQKSNSQFNFMMYGFDTSVGAVV